MKGSNSGGSSATQILTDDQKLINLSMSEFEKTRMPDWTRDDQIANHGGTQSGTHRTVKDLIENLMIRHRQFTLSDHEWEYIQKLREGKTYGDFDIALDITDLILEGKKKCPFNFGQYLSYVDTETRYDVHDKYRHIHKGLAQELLSMRRLYPRFPSDLTNDLEFDNGFRLVVASSLPQSHSIELFKKGELIYSMG